jgi:SAM-dependent methyltransferase
VAGYEGSKFYDDDNVFASYSRLRANAESANDTLEAPVIRELLGDVRGHHVLDLGCGGGGFGLELLAAGAGSNTGVEGSRNMEALARKTLQSTPAAIIHAQLEEFDYPVGQYSRVCARLVFHYLAHLEPLFERIYKALRPGGLLVFSVEHPVITSFDDAGDDSDSPRRWLVDIISTRDAGSPCGWARA